MKGKEIDVSSIAMSESPTNENKNKINLKKAFVYEEKSTTTKILAKKVCLN